MNETTGQSAVDRVRAYLDARRYILGDLDQIAEAKNGGSPWAYLTVTDLESLLAENAAVAADRDRVRNALREVLSLSWQRGHPGYEAMRTPWIETGRVHEWLYALSESERPTPATMPHAAPQRHADAPGPVEPGNETARGYEAPQGAAGDDDGPTLVHAERFDGMGRPTGHALCDDQDRLLDGGELDNGVWQVNCPTCLRLAREIAPEDEGISTADVLAQIAADEATERVPAYRDARREQHPNGGQR